MKKPSVCVKRRTAARRLPSTSTFTVPSGSRSSWMIVPIVPIVKMSSGIGSLVFALRCAERKISFRRGPLPHRLLERADRLLAADEQRHHHVREYDDVPQRQQWNAARTPLVVLAVRHPSPDRSNATGTDTK